MIRRFWCTVCLVILWNGVIKGAEIPADRAAPSAQQARARLAELREQVREQQREIRELEKFLDETTQIRVEIQWIEVDPTEGRRAGLPIFLEEIRSMPQSDLTAVMAKELPSQVLPSKDAARIVDRLLDEDLAKIVRNSKLVTESGRASVFLSGGEFPILVPQKDDAVSIEWRKFGVEGEVTPTILESGRVRVAFSSTVSERDFSNAVKINGMTMPGITSRRFNASVEMDFGKTYVMFCGINVREKEPPEPQGVPIANKLPYVNRLFKNVQVSHEEAESETALVVFVTPELVPHRD